MLKPILTLSFLLFFGFGLYAQPKAVGKPRVVAKTSESLERPAWSDNGKALYATSLEDGATWEASSNGKTLNRLPANKSPQRKSAGSNLLLQQMKSDPRGVTTKIQGLETLKGYIVFNAVLSPQRDKIVFEVSRGKGMFICNADGSGLRSLGTGAECATWTPDGKYVVVQTVKDDGHVILSGELMAIDVASGERTTLLSSNDYIALNPSLSPDGKSVAFEDRATGVIYVMDIKE